MLQSIREHTQGWIAGIIISIIIVTFALWGIHSYFEGGANNKPIAEVNGVAITKDQLAASFERLRRQAQAQLGGKSGSNAAKDDAALKERALHALIDIEVLKQASIKEKFLISSVQIDSYLQSMPEFQVGGEFSVERFQELLSSALLSTSEFLELIKTSLLIDQPKLGIVFTSFALPAEVSYTIALVNQEREIEYINLPFQAILADTHITSDNIQSYYDEHKKDFMTPEQVNVEYVQLSLKDLQTSIKPTDAMLKNFYNENINSYTQSMQWKLVDMFIPVAADATQADMEKTLQNAQAALKAIEKGEDFNKVAASYTHVLDASEWVTLNQLPAELQKDVANLVKAGQVSDLIKTPKGIVIVKVVAVKEPKMQAFEEVKDKVKDAYIHQHAEEKFAELREQLADLTYEHPDSLQLAATTLNLPILSSIMFEKDKSGKDISQYKKVREIAFSNDVLNLQNNSDVIQLNPDTVIVIRVKSHIPSSLLSLNQVAKQIENKLKTQVAENQLAKIAQDFTAKLAAGSDSQQLANAAHYNWVKTGFIGRYSTKVDSAILDTAFRLPNPLNEKSKNGVYGVTRIPNGYAIVAVKSVKEGSVADEKQFVVFAEQVQNSEGMLEYELYRQSQTNKAKIEIMQQ
jgi:peptidyl-prolyl cis-trans isomerase D